MLEQERHELSIAMIGTQMQGGFPVRGLRVDRRAFFQEEGGHLAIACCSCDVEGGRAVRRGLVDQGAFF